MRRKRFQRGCVRKVKHGRRWVWIGKYYEEGTSRTKVLGQCAEMTEGAALAKLQEFLRPLNETAGMRQGLPSTLRRTFQTSTCLNGGRSGKTQRT